MARPRRRRRAQRQRDGRARPAPAHRRRDHGFAALVDPAAGGRTLQALLGITLAAGVDSDAFANQVARLEPVTEVLHLTGTPDYQLPVACRDSAELDALLRTLRLGYGAADTETTVILRSGPATPRLASAG